MTARVGPLRLTIRLADSYFVPVEGVAEAPALSRVPRGHHRCVIRCDEVRLLDETFALRDADPNPCDCKRLAPDVWMTCDRHLSVDVAETWAARQIGLWHAQLQRHVFTLVDVRFIPGEMP